MELASRYSRLVKELVAAHQCTLLTTLGRTRVQRVTMPCSDTSLDRNWREAREERMW